MKKKILVSVVAAVLVLCCAIGGTLAWLTAKTEPLVNTFTVGDVEIDLKETTSSYKMIPGYTIEKDPLVTVKQNSEDCWLFVKVEKSENFDNFMKYETAAGWTALPDIEGVFYREVKTGAADQSFSVLKDDRVTVLNSVTKQMLDGLNEENRPTLTFTAYAVQQHTDSENDFKPAEAWEVINTSVV